MYPEAITLEDARIRKKRFGSKKTSLRDLVRASINAEVRY